MEEYQKFLSSKVISLVDTGFDVNIDDLNTALFPFQKDIVKWALKKGKAAIFADCGLGKTPMQLEWASQIHAHNGGNILIVAPLVVSMQTEREGVKFGIPVNICKSQSDVKSGINITNYERIGKFNPDDFVGIVLDESSILKSYSGKIRSEIISKFQKIPYKLACTATPAPNDYMELGNHAEFLDVMTRSEMLAMFFIHDGADTAKWRLKGHVRENIFWEWMCQWSVMITKPSDLGYDDMLFILPPLEFHEHVIKTETPFFGEMFIREASGLNERRKARRESMGDRVALACGMVTGDAQWLLWCDLNDESKALSDTIPDAVEVKGADDIEFKEKSMIDFSSGKIKHLVTKPKIAGHGMNWQIAAM